MYIPVLAVLVLSSWHRRSFPAAETGSLLANLFYHRLVQIVFLRKGSSPAPFTRADTRLARLRATYQSGRPESRPRENATTITIMEVASGGLLVIRKTMPSRTVARVCAAV